MYKRSEYQVIMNRLKEQRKFIQVVMGTRQINGYQAGVKGFRYEETNYYVFHRNISISHAM